MVGEEGLASKEVINNFLKDYMRSAPGYLEFGLLRVCTGLARVVQYKCQ